ncbi:MAG: hypothetical protein HZA58_05645 [Acidimicrobiia bacterium]|nr:hypothetical protein [Acidimicrobiia bacterium]
MIPGPPRRTALISWWPEPWNTASVARHQARTAGAGIVAAVVVGGDGSVVGRVSAQPAAIMSRAGSSVRDLAVAGRGFPPTEMGDIAEGWQNRRNRAGGQPPMMSIAGRVSAGWNPSTSP